MKNKDFRVELRNVSTVEKPGRCKITIYNDGESNIDAPEILINTEGHHWGISAEDNFKVTSGPSATILSGVLTDKKSIPAKGHQEFTILSKPAITKDSYPKDFYLGFRFGNATSDSFFAKANWETKPPDASKAEYATAIVALTNNLATLEDPFLIFETVKGETLTDAGSDVDIDPTGHGAVLVDETHELHFMEFSGGSPKNQLKKGNREIKLGVNRGSLSKPKPLELPTNPWIGFEISVAFIPC
jgi:hypothetical protein